MAMDAKKTLLCCLAIALSGCAGAGKPFRMASTTSYCPTGTVMVCSGLYEPERELAPSCGCADLMGGR